MAEEVERNITRRDWKKRESLPSALVQILIVCAILAGAVYFKYSRDMRKKETAEGLKEARALAVRGNPQDLKKALGRLDEIFAIDAEAPDALALAGDIHAQLWLIHREPGSEAKARDFIARATARESKSGERFGNHALFLVIDGKAKDADEYVENLRQQGASDARLWHAQARAKQALGELSLARQAFAQAADKAWKEAQFGAAYAEALFDEGLFNPALEALKKAVGANPDHFMTRLNTALVKVYRSDRVKEAADALQEILGRDAELSPGLKARALTVRAGLALFEGRHDDALKDVGEALTLNPDENYALLLKARALALKKDPGVADAVQAAIAKRKTAPLFYFEGAQLLQLAGNPDAAMGVLDSYAQTFKDVTTVTPDGKTIPALDRDDRFWLAKGDLLRDTGKLDEALAAYDRAIAAESVNLVRAHYARASVFMAKKDYDKAVEVLAAITPTDGSGALPEAYLAMGDTLFAKRDFATGCQHYAFALTKLKTQQAPREKLNGILEDVSKRLRAAGQAQMASAWVNEAKPLIQ